MDNKEYNFYGWETAKCSPVSDKYELISGPQMLYDLLSSIWCEYTCAPRIRSNWTEDNKTLGQCSITAFLVQDIFGGQVYGIERPGGNYHCYNVVGDSVFDLTSEQFGEEAAQLVYENNPEQYREVHFAKDEKRERYEYLKAELDKRMFKAGDIVTHFKRENQPEESAQYLYEIVDTAHHSETGETMLAYRALYYPYKICVRPLSMFLSPVDREKYPDVKQKYRFEMLLPAPEIVRWREDKKYLLKAYHAQNLTARKGQTVFVGSSLMEMFPITELAREHGGLPICYNRGVGGYRTDDLMKVLDITVFELEPSKIFINIGTNDLSDANVTITDLVEKYRFILRKITEKLPKAQITAMAYYPGNLEAAPEHMKACLKIRNNARIAEANAAVKKMCEEENVKFIDVNQRISDEQGRLRAEYTLEGLHINRSGYLEIFDELVTAHRERF